MQGKKSELRWILNIVDLPRNLENASRSGPDGALLFAPLIYFIVGPVKSTDAHLWRTYDHLDHCFTNATCISPVEMLSIVQMMGRRHPAGAGSRWGLNTLWPQPTCVPT